MNFTITHQTIKFAGTDVLVSSTKDIEFGSPADFASFLNLKKAESIDLDGQPCYYQHGTGEVKTEVYSLGGGLNRNQRESLVFKMFEKFLVENCG